MLALLAALHAFDMHRHAGRELSDIDVDMHRHAGRELSDIDASCGEFLSYDPNDPDAPVPANFCQSCDSCSPGQAQQTSGDGHCPTVTENSGNLIASRRRGWDYPVNSGQQDPNVDLGTSMRCVVSPDGAPELTSSAGLYRSCVASYRSHCLNGGSRRRRYYNNELNAFCYLSCDGAPPSPPTAPPPDPAVPPPLPPRQPPPPHVTRQCADPVCATPVAGGSKECAPALCAEPA